MNNELISIMEKLNNDELLFAGIEETEITEKMEFLNEYGKFLNEYKEEY